MLHALTIELENQPVEPPDLLARLAARGVRLLDGRRYLLLDAPPEVLAEPEWPELEAAASRSGQALQNLAVLIAMTRQDTRPHDLVERMMALPAACLPVLVEALGGAARLGTVASELSSEAQVDLCFAAYLQALSFQVAHGLETDDDERDEDDQDDEPSGSPDDAPQGMVLSAPAGGEPTGTPVSWA